MRISLALVSFSLFGACASVPERRAPERTGPELTDTKSTLQPATPATWAFLQPRQVEGEPIAASAAPATWAPLQPYEFQVEPLRDFTAPLKDEGIGTSYTALRLGSISPQGDTRSLDSGVWGELAFGRRILGVFGVEALIGYFDAEGSGGAEVEGIPILINGRLSVPILILEPYAGLGLGGVWANAKAGGFSSEDTFAVMYDAFIGCEVGLGGFALGLEYRYVVSGDLDNPGGIGVFQLEGNVFLLVGRLPF